MSALVVKFPDMARQETDAPLPNRLRYWRKRRGLTLIELAAMAHTAHGHVARMETGKRELTIGWMRIFARALDIEVADLLNQEDGGLADRERRLLDTYREVPEAMRGVLDAVAEQQQAFRGAAEVVPFGHEADRKAG